MSTCRVLVPALLVAVVACGPADVGSGGGDCSAPAGGVVVRFDAACVSAEVAATADERARGLMHRTELAPDAGMLFVFPRPSEGGFWMKNTLIPLSIAFMHVPAPGRLRVLAIMDMEPCRTDECPIYDPGTAYEAALEVDEGWFARAGVEVGAEARVVGTLRKAS